VGKSVIATRAVDFNFQYFELFENVAQFKSKEEYRQRVAKQTQVTFDTRLKAS